VQFHIFAMFAVQGKFLSLSFYSTRNSEAVFTRALRASSLPL
jgi:hypothetical protein